MLDYLRPRKHPSSWSDEEIRRWVRATYLGADEVVFKTGAVVFYLPEGVMPRKAIKSFQAKRGAWLPYRWYGLAWSLSSVDYHMLGDDVRSEVIQARDSHLTEAGARDEAKEWLVQTPGAVVRDVAWDDAPSFARAMASTAVRHGM